MQTTWDNPNSCNYWVKKYTDATYSIPTYDPQWPIIMTKVSEEAIAHGCDVRATSNGPSVSLSHYTHTSPSRSIPNYSKPYGAYRHSISPTDTNNFRK